MRELKNAIEAFNSRWDRKEEWIRQLKNKTMRLIQIAAKWKNNLKSKYTLIRDLWDNIIWNNVCIIGVLEEEEREIMRTIIWRNRAENFPNLGKETDIQVQEAQRYSDKMNAKRSTPKPIIKIAKVKDKERIIKAARDKDFLHTRKTL